MNNELLIKKCNTCGSLIKIITDCNCDDGKITCCGKTMDTLVANSIDAAVEKHIPNYETLDTQIFVTVKHVMEEEHFIEWICLISNDKEYFIKLSPNQNAKCYFPYIPDSYLYAYCNKHGLWKKHVI